MSILAFQKPDKVIMLDSDDKIGKFEFRPLEQGYGITIGNALRRILISSLEGYAITSIRIDGIDHEFSAMAGIREDVTDIVLNLKQIRFKQEVEDVEEEKVTINITGQDTFKGGDIEKFISGFKVLNPEHVICNLTNPDVRFQMEMTIKKGRGYVTSDENKPLEPVIGLIPVDSIFTPIKNVNYHIEDYRVEQKTDFEKLVINIETDGSVMPKDALKEAATILIKHFMLFSDEKITEDVEEKEETEEFDEEILHMRQLLKTKLVDLDLSVRALNCLKAADVETLSELVAFNRNDLLKFRNFGKKSLTELNEMLVTMNLDFGMDITKYKLDQE
ncbi:MAG: DNA-directed RNA polymerase subunit alpha [Bacteroidetes bacterium]|jgi:DNA-directed RNA polymerase subunit alpha|nr:DNA-directed RNA polymerase subunit alpha [Bacteroidota bacterium]MBT6684863.1 DNA-directed RNA polymerase subunit alpha [Bacteroidota bacterium]MBT7142557.1 DNA-directed RNA polymerase subunit alpha [Bacteroidota bacterium]MBT7493254.1 DNA-directed RNA polymerase subunit alpha [Bacteroidota bacterium]